MTCSDSLILLKVSRARIKAVKERIVVIRAIIAPGGPASALFCQKRKAADLVPETATINSISVNIEQLQQELLALGGDPQDSLTFCAERGLTVLGLGRSRLAIPKSERAVYKLAWRSLGLAENSLEQRVYQQAPEDLRAVLAPVLNAEECGVIAQGRCQPTELGLEAAEVLHTLSRYGIVDGVLNLGRYQGRVVCYDYALLGTERFFQVTAD